MINIKFPIRIIILLILTVIVNIFSTVTIEYNAISFQEYRNIEIVCGDLYSVLTNNDIDQVPSLNVNINKWIYAELVETKNMTPSKEKKRRRVNLNSSVRFCDADKIE